MRNIVVSLLLLLLLPTMAVGQEPPRVQVKPAFPQLRFNQPLFLTSPPGEADRLFVAEQGGRVVWFEHRPDADELHTAIELKVGRQNWEEGLLGLAFDPDFQTNRHVYLYYTAPDYRPRRSVVSRFTFDAALETIDPDSEKILLTVRQPFGNHNGGMLAFGPDGYLYISLGDGGAGGDPRGNGQDRSTLLGSILRIDVHGQAQGKAYAIPEDNPFVDTPGARPEIFAYGLRNAWRFSFDRETGQLWAGDVGQNAWEEIDLITRGGNYGWNILEGTHRYDVPRSGVPEDLIPPVVEHPRSEARSITGGYVYRGRAIPELRGWYVYADFGTGLVFALRAPDGKLEREATVSHVQAPTSFGEDAQGELYITSFDGRIYQVQAGR